VRPKPISSDTTASQDFNLSGYAQSSTQAASARQHTRFHRAPQAVSCAVASGKPHARCTARCHHARRRPNAKKPQARAVKARWLPRLQHGLLRSLETSVNSATPSCPCTGLWAGLPSRGSPALFASRRRWLPDEEISASTLHDLIGRWTGSRPAFTATMHSGTELTPRRAARRPRRGRNPEADPARTHGA
jgi:hypothetical protein